MNQTVNEMTLNGVEYVRKDSVSTPERVMGKRVIVVVDRGWVWCGDVEDRGGRVLLSNAVHVLRWESVGFAGMVNGEDFGKIKTKKVGSVVDIPKDAEVFRVPVADDWGM